ncbi:tripartite tricarboxylate transporter substrate binding protein [Orrella marina]|uniref:Tripartite tricarboxylate transporter substrate binding protein n=3 Tax=Pseudomonadota TaxID=1224 RepID=A0A2R4XPH1_9BURK|nr:tripartite tricarboxylate transporter substrate binding protein [Orrella marina]
MAVLSSALAFTTIQPVAAQSAFPDKTITIVVPYSAGGSNDRFARLVAGGLSKELDVPVVVDNRPGASGVTGSMQVARAAPDGYTLLVVSSSMTTNEAVRPREDFNPVKNLTPVAMLAKGPFIVAVNNEFPAKTPQEFVELIKANPGKFNYASSGIGSSNQFATELLQMLAGLESVHVPYKGMAQATTDLIGGQTEILIASGPSLLPHIRGERARAIGVTSLNESAIAPDLVPISSVVPGYEFELWWGVFAPAGLPADIQELLNTKINAVINAPEMRQTFLNDGAEAAPTSAEDFGKRVADDIDRWKDLAKRQNITVN